LRPQHFGSEHLWRLPRFSCNFCNYSSYMVHWFVARSYIFMGHGWIFQWRIEQKWPHLETKPLQLDDRWASQETKMWFSRRYLGFSHFHRFYHFSLGICICIYLSISLSLYLTLNLSTNTFTL
jgi:hypothetical protein